MAKKRESLSPSLTQRQQLFAVGNIRQIAINEC